MKYLLKNYVSSDIRFEIIKKVKKTAYLSCYWPRLHLRYSYTEETYKIEGNKWLHNTSVDGGNEYTKSTNAGTSVKSVSRVWNTVDHSQVFTLTCKKAWKITKKNKTDMHIKFC